jgi:threonine synthase
MDTHTAVAYASYLKYVKETGDTTPNVVVSTASPYKFAKDVLKAIDSKYDGIDPFKALDTLEEVSGVAIPAPIKGIADREVLHKIVVERDALKDFVKERLNK